jgi:hypothetical protein
MTSKKSTKTQTKLTQKPNSLSMVGVSYGYQRPQVMFRSDKPTRKGATARFVGCDYYGVVSTATSAGFTNIPIWPTNSTTFPRLSAISSAFELYFLTKCKVWLVGVAASTQAGTATAVYVYNTDSLSPTFSLAQLRNEERNITLKFWENGVTEMDTGRSTRPWYILENATIYTDAYQAMLVIGCDATTSAVAAFDVFIEYDCEFAQGQSTTAPEWFAPLRDAIRDPKVAERVYEALLSLGVLKQKRKREATLADVQRASRGGMLKFDSDPTHVDLGDADEAPLTSAKAEPEKSLDVLAAAASTRDKIPDWAKAQFETLTREDALDVLATLLRK